jgi:uncharacterized protein YkwD
MLIVLTLALLAAVALGPAAGVAAAHARSATRTHGARCKPASSGRSAKRAARRCPVSSTLAYARKGPVRRGRHANARRAGAPAGAHLQPAAATKVAAAPCPNAQLMPEAGNLALIRAAVLCLVNNARAQNGEQPLRDNAQLDAAAEAHVQDMLANDYFEHVSPKGSTPVDRVRASGYIPSAPVGYVIGENLAWGTLSLATPQAIVSAWIASPGHLANILESQYRDSGIAVAAQVPSSLADGVAGATYGQEFGVITR